MVGPLLGTNDGANQKNNNKLTLAANRWLVNTALQMKNMYLGKLIFIHKIYYILVRH